MEVATKEAILEELRRRKVQKDWQERLSKIESCREQKLEERRKKITEKNREVFETLEKHKQSECEKVSNNFHVSQTFLDKFCERD